MAGQGDTAADGRNLVLTGFMGTGKTTVGKLLARRLGRPFVDTDAVIEERHGPIPLIFRELGEARFRALERQVASELAGREGLVIATGGRLLLDPRNAETLGATGTVVCLVASVEEILSRVAVEGAEPRPLLEGPDPRRRVESLLAERRAGYATFPQVLTDGRSPEQVAAEVCRITGLDPA